jgi:hypothetical protein
VNAKGNAAAAGASAEGGGGGAPSASDIENLVSMGFPANRAEKALILCDGKNVESAVEWLFAHQGDADIDDAMPSAAGAVQIDEWSQTGTAGKKQRKQRKQEMEKQRAKQNEERRTEQKQSEDAARAKASSQASAARARGAANGAGQRARVDVRNAPRVRV